MVTQIGPVLDLEFPNGIQRILNMLKPLAIDLQSILQLDCLAGSDFTFYAFWVRSMGSSYIYTLCRSRQPESAPALPSSYR